MCARGARREFAVPLVLYHSTVQYSVYCTVESSAAKASTAIQSASHMQPAQRPYALGKPAFPDRPRAIVSTEAARLPLGELLSSIYECGPGRAAVTPLLHDCCALLFTFSSHFCLSHRRMCDSASLPLHKPRCTVDPSPCFCSDTAAFAITSLQCIGSFASWRDFCCGTTRLQGFQRRN